MTEPSDLGPVVSSHSDAAQSADAPLLLIPFGIAAVLGFIGLAAILGGGEFCLGSSALGLAGGFAFAGVHFARKMSASSTDGDRLDIHALGFAQWRGGKATAFRWDEIQGVYDRRQRHVQVVGEDQHARFFTVLSEDNRTLMLFDQRAALIERELDQHAGPRWHARARRELAEGRTEFGYVAATKTALIVGARETKPRSFAWRDINSLSFDDGHLVVEMRDGGRFQVAQLGAIENLAVFLATVKSELGVVIDPRSRL